MFSSYYIYTISVALLQGCSCASPLASAKHCFRGCMCSSSRAHHPSPFPPESLRSCSRVHMTRQVNLGPGQRQEGRGRGGLLCFMPHLEAEWHMQSLPSPSPWNWRAARRKEKALPWQGSVCAPLPGSSIKVPFHGTRYPWVWVTITCITNVQLKHIVHVVCKASGLGQSPNFEWPTEDMQKNPSYTIGAASQEKRQTHCKVSVNFYISDTYCGRTKKNLL